MFAVEAFNAVLLAISDHAEAEFMAVCDINKESRQVIQDLNNAQVFGFHPC